MKNKYWVAVREVTIIPVPEQQPEIPIRWYRRSWKELLVTEGIRQVEPACLARALAAQLPS